MKKIFIALLINLMAFAVINVSIAEIIKVTNIPLGPEKLKASDKASGKELWRSEIRRQIINYDGQPFLYCEEKGAGVYGNDKRNKTWAYQSYFVKEATRLIPQQVKIAFKNEKGGIISSIDKFYDQKTRKIICDVNGKRKEFDFKQDVIDTENLGVCLNNYPFEEKRDLNFYLLTHEPTLYKITIKYRGQEKIAIGKNEFECHKLEMIPDLGALNIFGAFVPKTYFWFETKSPHHFVRYEGLESGLGTPYIDLDLVK
jgi:hypothetical protein